MIVPKGTHLPVLIVADTRKMNIENMPQYAGQVAVLLGIEDKKETWKLGFITTEDYDAHVSEQHGQLTYNS